MDRSGVRYLGIEGGGTRTVALLADADLNLAARQEFGPGNLRLLSDAQVLSRFREIRTSFQRPSAIGVGMAGLRDAADRARVLKAAAKIWGVPCAATHDLDIALRAGALNTPAKILVLSGTGSCCYGRADGRAEAKVGGWGHWLGDRGSGYDISISALRAVIRAYDRENRWGILGQTILRWLLLNEPNDLIGWIQSASKSEVAALAPAVFDAAEARDGLARTVLSEASETLAADALICAERLEEAPGFLLAGSVLLKQKSFAREIAQRIRTRWPDAPVEPLTREGAWGAVELARQLPSQSEASESPGASIYFPDFSPGQSPTEQRNPRSMNFDRLSVEDEVALMLDEEESVAAALRAEGTSIVRATKLGARVLKGGGRIFYAGAGTSGRLGVLDASECPPTFRADPEMIQGIMAGGQRALWQAVEGAEDDARAGQESVRFRGVKRGDLLIGIAASGRTPFVWGALAAARAAGARTILLHFNPSLAIRRSERPDVVIAPNLGPEVLTGSTRLKCGTATKLVLNIISTISMVRLGKVVGNLMVDLNPSNVKLRDRAVRIVQELTGAEAGVARQTLEAQGWVVKRAAAALAGKRRSTKKS